MYRAASYFFIIFFVYVIFFTTFALPLTPKIKVTILNNPFNEVEVRGYGFKRVLFLDMETTTMTYQLKLTLASGVVHGLKCRLKHDTKSVFRITAFNFLKNTVTISSELGHVYGTWGIDDIEFLMHPTSKLTSPILPDGKIPIVELAKMAFPHYDWESNSQHAFSYDGSEYIRFLFNGKSFSAGTNYHFFIPDQLALFDQLDAWHINYRGVEAVEIETSIND